MEIKIEDHQCTIIANDGKKITAEALNGNDNIGIATITPNPQCKTSRPEALMN